MAKTGYLAKLECDSGASNAYETIGTQVMIKLDGIKTHVVETLGLNGITKTKVPGTNDSGTLSLDIFYTSADYTKLFGLLRTTKNWRITEPDATTGSQTITGAGFIEELSGPEWQHDNVAKMSVKIAISGPWALGVVP